MSSNIFSWGDPACVAVSEKFADVCLREWECVAARSLDEATALKSNGFNVVLICDAENTEPSDLIDGVARESTWMFVRGGGAPHLIHVPGKDEPAWFARDIYGLNFLNYMKTKTEYDSRFYYTKPLFRYWIACVGVRVRKQQDVPLVGDVIRGYTEEPNEYYTTESGRVEFNYAHVSPRGFPRWSVGTTRATWQGLMMVILYEEEPAPPLLVSVCDVRGLRGAEAEADECVLRALADVQKNLGGAPRNNRLTR